MNFRHRMALNKRQHFIEEQVEGNWKIIKVFYTQNTALAYLEAKDDIV